MTKPLPFTNEEMSRVFDTNLIEYAISQGFDVVKADRKSYRVKDYGGLFLFPKGYHHFSETDSGNIVGFAKKYQGFSFIEAVEHILQSKAYANTIPQMDREIKRGALTLPPESNTTSKILKYLTEERCLDKDIVAELIQQRKILEVSTQSKGAVFTNCAFVSYDSDNKPRYCALRGLGKSNFRQDVRNSDKTFGFVMNGTGNRIFVFESPIDTISHATQTKLNDMDFKEDYRISEGCLSDKALAKFLSTNPQITEIVFCYDNDVNGKNHEGKPHNHGQEFAKKCAKKYMDKGYKVFIHTPTRKDFNADLQFIQKSVMKQLRDMQSDIPKNEKKKGELKAYER